MKLRQFMYGRYGNDTLNNALLILWLVLNIFNNLIFRSFVVRIFLLLIVGVIIFRVLSKNIEQRTKENQLFLRYYYMVKPYLQKIKPWWQGVVGWFKLQQKKFRDRKTFRYLKCPYCKASIRVPFVKGKHSLYCPRCNEKFKTNIII